MKCAKHCKTSEKAVQCQLCELWVHQVCPGRDKKEECELSDELFKALDLQKTLTGGAYWVCASCSAFSARFEKRVNELARATKAAEGRLDQHDKKFEKLEEEVEALKKIAKDNTAKAQPEAVKETVTGAVFREIRERETKRHSVVIHGLPEAPAAIKEGKLRRDADFVKLQEMIAILELEMDASNKVRTAARLGGKRGDSARPLLVSFRDPKDQEEILSSSKKLSSAGAVWKSVRVLQDLTKIQRQEDKLLRDEASELAAQLNEEEAKNWEFKVVGRRGARRVIKVPVSAQAEVADNAVPTSPVATAAAVQAVPPMAEVQEEGWQVATSPRARRVATRKQTQQVLQPATHTAYGANRGRSARK